MPAPAPGWFIDGVDINQVSAASSFRAFITPPSVALGTSQPRQSVATASRPRGRARRRPRPRSSAGRSRRRRTPAGRDQSAHRVVGDRILRSGASVGVDGRDEPLAEAKEEKGSPLTGRERNRVYKALGRTVADHEHDSEVGMRHVRLRSHVSQTKERAAAEAEEKARSTGEQTSESAEAPDVKAAP